MSTNFQLQKKLNKRFIKANATRVMARVNKVKRVTKQIRVPIRIHDQIQAASKKERRTMSKILERMCDDYTASITPNDEI